ncbi:hypothetical protein Halxa_0228 (plasmid) [Halopiger xanaduensis SH-6]|uniref:Uncharacterized protein n=1 Tax=Halopiger xanaduensis (strain DSM 18323 / JCM 14033 / SH-6) TaxID=797210 RepID=F8DEN1_HALXS|nr:hypothetical protein Halxa_0228 [Halopiger xanaduensis SH-6]
MSEASPEDVEQAIRQLERDQQRREEAARFYQ